MASAKNSVPDEANAENPEGGAQTFFKPGLPSFSQPRPSHDAGVASKRWKEIA